MRKRQHFSDSVAELQLIQAKIVLKLPASRESIHRQVHQIGQAQQALDRLQASALDKPSRFSAPLDSSSKALTRLILQASRYAESLKLLAEEFPVDPQGTVACLRQLCRRHLQRSEQLKQLAQDTARPKSA
ncbi:hypothetical protein [Vacuolonema iberomarrocanum]|uniref:hypothetical protein n=1 Tax=Vacuolonema iberomarrocanum TaxID=3454632 RepID=UPI003F6E0FCA